MAAHSRTEQVPTEPLRRRREPCSANLFARNSASVNHQEIRKEVLRVIGKLPREFRQQLHNVEIVVEARPSAELLLEEGLDPRHDTLYGIYQGVPLPERSLLDP